MRRIKFIVAVLLCVGSHLSLSAQFNPDSPKEPQANFKVRTSVQPQAAATWISVWDENYDGYYSSGECVHLECPAVNGVYTFSHWTLDGEVYSNECNMSYVIDDKSVSFVAHYEYNVAPFDPESPDEPFADLKNYLYLVSEPLTACSFNQSSGLKWSYDEWIYLYTYPNGEGLVFLGWYNGNGVKVSDSRDFSFQMPDENLVLIARYEYAPISPSDPDGGGMQDNVQNHVTGDANGDGVADIANAVRVVKMSLAGEYTLEADTNYDGVVDVTDAVGVINICLKKKQ